MSEQDEKCSKCGHKLVDRAFDKCMYCGEPLPEDLRLPEEEKKKILAEKDKRYRESQEERRGKNKKRPGQDLEDSWWDNFDSGGDFGGGDF